jgi:nitrite reductase/ring-hydroxylating ferredoxin subunit
LKEEGFYPACKVDDLTEKCGRRFIVNDVDVAMFKVDGDVYALSNVCPHKHTALIYDGYIENGCVVCPIHGWMFDLKTGIMPSKKSGLDSFPVKIEEGKVFVKAGKKELNW